MYHSNSAKTSPASKYVSLEPFRSEMYEGHIPVPIEVIPKFRYKGPKMPLSLWQQVLHWFKTNSKGEAMIRFFVDFEAGTWHAIPFPQYYPTGMSVKEIEGHELTPNTGNLVQLGSAHHHCTAGAFPSGTDDADEAKIEGLHLIVGNLDKMQQSVFLRLSVVVPGELENGRLVKPSRQVFIPEEMLDLRDLFTDPALSMLPYPLQGQVIRAYLTQYFGLVSYPKEWDEMLIPPPAKVLPAWSIPTVSGGTSYVVPSQNTKPAKTKASSEKKSVLPADLVALDSDVEEDRWSEDWWMQASPYRQELYFTLEQLYNSDKPGDTAELMEVLDYCQGKQTDPPDLVCEYGYYLSADEIQKVVSIFMEDYEPDVEGDLSCPRPRKLF
jgi:hypothetical protein